MIEPIEKKSRLERTLTVLVWLGIFLHLAVFAITNICGFELYCDADMYPDTLIAKYIWEEKSLFPEGWGFGNQLYVVATPVLAALFYGLTGSLNWSMILATETMTILIVICFLWVVRAITKDRLLQASSLLLLIGVVVAPMEASSYNLRLFFLQASYYACYLITLFVVYGDYIRSFQTEKLRPWALGLSILLSFATGMQSLRQTVVMILPILACEVFLALRRLLCREKMWNSQIRGTLLRVGGYTVANVLGVAAVKWMDIPQVNITGDMSLIPFGEMGERLASVAEALLQVTGLDFLLGSEKNPFYGFASLVMVALCIAAGVIWFLKIRYPKTPLELCWLLSLVGIAGTALSSIVLNITIKERYLFLYYPLVAFSGLIVLRSLPSIPKQVVVLLLCGLCVGNLFHCQKIRMEAALLNDTSIVGKAFRLARDYGYHTLAWTSEELVDARNMADWAVEEGYEYIYGEWAVVPYIAVQSDGKLEAGYWHTVETIYQPLDYINAQDIYGDLENEKALYVFYEDDEQVGIQTAQERGVTMTKVAQFGDYRAYISPVPLMEAERQ